MSLPFLCASTYWITEKCIATSLRIIMVSSADSCLYLSVCVVMGAIAMILCFSWMFVRKYFKGPDVDWELLNRQNELE